jgi:hypothetical protein
MKEFMPNSQPKTKLLSPTDLIFFKKAVQAYFFFKQELKNPISDSIQEEITKGQNLVYSLVLDYLSKERFEIAFLQEINELLKDIHSIAKKLGISEEFIIQPNQLAEIELQELVPLQFNDADSGKSLQLLFNEKASVCMWSLSE